MQLSPDGLAKLYDLPVEATIPGMQLQAQMMQSGELANQKQGIENLYNSQNNPLLVEQTRLENDSKRARIPGEAAQSRSFQLKADRDAATQDQAIAAARAKFLQDASDADIAELESRAQKMAYSLDPAQRAQGEQILRMHKDILKEREKQNAMFDRQERLERLKGEEARKTLAARPMPVGGAGGVNPVAAGKAGFEKSAAAAFYLAQEALQAGNDAEYQRQMGIANEYLNQLIQLRQAGPAATQAGKIDTGAVAKLPTVPARPVTPFGGQPTQAQPKAPATDAAVFQKAFGGYEPNKYSYRIGPNGVPQRKLKGS